MIFDKDKIETDSTYASRPSYVSSETVIEKVTEAINNKLAFGRDYVSGKWIRLENAEDFIIQMHSLIKDFSK